MRGSPLAASATMSGTGADDAERSKVLTPVSVGAGTLFDPDSVNATSVDGKGAVGVSEMT